MRIIIIIQREMEETHRGRNRETGGRMERQKKKGEK